MSTVYDRAAAAHGYLSELRLAGDTPDPVRIGRQHRLCGLKHRAQWSRSGGSGSRIRPVEHTHALPQHEFRVREPREAVRRQETSGVVGVQMAEPDGLDLLRRHALRRQCRGYPVEARPEHGAAARIEQPVPIPRRIRNALTGSGDGPFAGRPAPFSKACPAWLSAAGIMLGSSGKRPSRNGVTVNAPTRYGPLTGAATAGTCNPAGAGRTRRAGCGGRGEATWPAPGEGTAPSSSSRSDETRELIPPRHWAFFRPNELWLALPGGPVPNQSLASSPAA